MFISSYHVDTSVQPLLVCVQHCGVYLSCLDCLVDILVTVQMLVANIVNYRQLHTPCARKINL